MGIVDKKVEKLAKQIESGEKDINQIFYESYRKGLLINGITFSLFMLLLFSAISYWVGFSLVVMILAIISLILGNSVLLVMFRVMRRTHLYQKEVTEE